MRIENKVIGISILLGLLIGLTDSIIDYLLFYEKPFWDLLIFDVPKFEIYVRSIILIVFTISGFIVSKIIVRHRKAEQKQNDFLHLVLDSLKHPFCVIDPVDYTIKMANSAVGLEQQEGNSTCHAIMHNNDTPCNSIEHPCPIAIIKKTKKPVTLEPLHYDKDGNPKNIEIHAHPILDSNGNVSQIIEYSYDITERKKDEELLRESKQIIEGIINAMPVRVFWKDKNFVFLGCNVLFAQDAGYADPKDIIGKDDYQMVWRDQAELYRNDDRQVMESGDAKLLIEEPQTTPEGKTVTLLTSKIPLRSSEGEVIGVLGTYMEITDRKEAEQLLRETEEKYRTLFESSRDAIMTLAPPTWLFTSGNPATVQLFRVNDEAEFISLGPWQLSPEKQPDGNPSAEKAVEMIETAMRNGSHFFEWTHCHSDGTPFPAEVLLTRMEQKGQMLLQATVRDITERRRAEEKMRENEVHLRTLIRTIPDLVWLKDQQGIYLACNPRFESFFGAKEMDIIGKTDYDFVDKKLADFFRENDKIAIAKGKPSRNEEEVIFADDGHRETLETIKTPMYTINNQIIGVLGIGHDITERKRIEEEREKLIHELQNAMAEVKTLSGLLPICAHCKNVRDDKGYWNKIETYIHQHSGAQFSHGICPECANKFYPDLDLYDD